MFQATLLNHGEFNSRSLEITIGTKKLVTPTYFPAISSAATRLQLVPLIQVCVSSGYPRLLISAYDIFHLSKPHQKFAKKYLRKFLNQNFLFLDSGTFESYWLNDRKWTFEKYKKIIANTECDFYTSFDRIPSMDSSSNEISKHVVEYSKKSSKLENNNHCISVIHGQTSQLIKLVGTICNRNMQNAIIAIAERDCGKTLQDKINTIKKIRKTLNRKNETNVLHILGCGNPISMALFIMAGADSFDSVDWSRWLIDRKTLQFTDPTHRILLDCKCKVCSIKKIDPTLNVLLHNLLFYQNYLQDLRESIINGQNFNFLKKYIDKKFLSKIVKLF
ncbi:MAG: hypothetical protein FJ356_05195 [Thaumarchaeota archaeon]|nr:hypothetical protein [Nitrososphaerota archaeon]